MSCPRSFPIALDDVPENLVDSREQLCRNLHAARRDVLVKLLGTRSTDDCRGHVVVLQYPSHSKLGKGQAELVCDAVSDSDAVSDEMNDRPRKRLDFDTPYRITPYLIKCY